jgi:hypothetical protein
MFKFKGTIKVVNDTVQVTEKFKKREFVVSDDNETYPQTIMFQLAQDKTSIIDGFIEGQTVEVSFNLRGREWESPQGDIKYFNTLDAWRVEQVSAQSAENGNSSAQNSEPTPVPLAQGTPAADDDLPF